MKQDTPSLTAASRLRDGLARGVLSFPLTAFDEQGAVERRRLP